MKNLFILSLAPVLICLFYVYIRDKYEKEPINLLFTGVFYGIFMVAPVSQLENFIISFAPNSGKLIETVYFSFIVSSFSEEFFKFIILFFLVWKNNNFNERFDGIVYAVFISLGFAGIENVLYVFNPELGGAQTAFGRAIVSVPAHALFGISMGYYFALSKFEHHNRMKLLMLAFFMPCILHGIYNLIIMSQIYYWMILLIIFIVYMFINGFKKINVHLENSPFKKS